MRIVSETRAIDDCDERVRHGCFAVLDACFLGIRRRDFERDFAAKDAVMLLRDAATGAVGGFSTFVRLELDVDGAAVPIVFSGDTAVLPEFRTSLGLGHELSRTFVETPGLYPGRTAHYVLISKGWRTYRLLPFFFRSFYPRASEALPAPERRVRDVFGTVFAPDRYDAAAGILRGRADAPRLRPNSPDGRPPAGDPCAAFFLAANAGYLGGDELVCIARIAADNFAAGLRRLGPSPAATALA
jgi:hypothetical protein